MYECIDFWQMRLVDEENQVVNIGEEGEIQVKTYSRLKEYRVQEEKTRQLFTDDGFLRTGWEREREREQVISPVIFQDCHLVTVHNP